MTATAAPTVFRSRVDALAARVLSWVVAARWRRFSGRRGRAENPAQRPHIYLSGLTGHPWWDPAQFPWVAQIEAQADVLRAELRELLRQGYLQPPPIETIPPARRDFDQMLVRFGAWHLYRLSYNGVDLPANCARCPETLRLFRSLPDQCGTVGFGVLAPGTHIAPHCGPINAKLRCHLGLEVPVGCRLRVERETRTWQEGRCLVFDDSFEHEVWNDGGRPRYIFLIDTYHPDLTPAERLWIERLSRRLVALAPARLRTALEDEPRVPPRA